MWDPPTVPFLAKAATRSLCYRAEELGKDDIDDVLVHMRACIGTWLSRDGAFGYFLQSANFLATFKTHIHPSEDLFNLLPTTKHRHGGGGIIPIPRSKLLVSLLHYFTLLLYMCGGVVS